MDRNILKPMFFAGVGLFLIGCAVPKKAAPPFNPVNLNPAVQSGDYVPKVDNFAIILDKSGSMGEAYKGRKKLDYATCLVNRMNHTIPDLDLTGSLRMFGRTAVFSDQFTQSLWGPAHYSAAALDNGLKKVDFSVGESPLNQALDATAQDLTSAHGNIALIIVSDANKEYMDYDAVLRSTRAIKDQYGRRLCIYTVQIGDNAEGRVLLQQTAEEGACGAFTNADTISSAPGMADFIQEVFLKKAPPKPEPKVIEKVVEEVVLDSDGDGVPDDLDKCPETPKGAIVNKFGCWTLEEVLFDFDKSTIKPEYHPFLDRVAAVFEKNPSLKVEIEGHTDNIGTKSYNMALSLRRANAVKEYLISRGIDKSRLSTKGYGFSRPISTNATKAGRALNRRVQLTPIR